MTNLRLLDYMKVYASNSCVASNFVFTERAAELESKIESLETELRESEAEASEVISRWQESCAVAESKCASVEEELRDLKVAKQFDDECSKDKDVDEDGYIPTVESLVQKEEQLRQLKEEVESMNHSMQNLKGTLYLISSCVFFIKLFSPYISSLLNCFFSYPDEVLALNKEIKVLSGELADQKVEAMNSIEEWKEKLGSSSREKTQLQADLQEAKTKMAELEDLGNKFSADDQMARQWEERNRELSESISLLEDQLKEQEQEAFDAVEQWQAACSDLEGKCADLELLVKENRETIATHEWSIEQLRSSNESYRVQIEELKASPSELESSLKENLANAEAEISRLSEMQEIEREKWAVDQRQFQVELQAEKERSVEARAEMEKFSSSLEEINTDSKETLLQWTGMYIDLLYERFSFVSSDSLTSLFSQTFLSEIRRIEHCFDRCPTTATRARSRSQ